MKDFKTKPNQFLNTCVDTEEASSSATFQKSLKPTGATGLGSFTLSRCLVSFGVSSVVHQATSKAKSQIPQDKWHPNQFFISKNQQKIRLDTDFTYTKIFLFIPSPQYSIVCFDMFFSSHHRVLKATKIYLKIQNLLGTRIFLRTDFIF